jgi:hypothetical protein
MTAEPNATDANTTDATMEAIAAAVTRGRNGEVDAARADLQAIWQEVGPTGDAFHRCTLAHCMADLFDDPARALPWDVRALDAADAVTDQRAKEHHASLVVAGFYPSLHLNLADNYRRLGSFEAAEDHLRAAAERVHHLDEGPYGDLIRGALTSVAVRDTVKRPSVP